MPILRTEERLGTRLAGKYDLANIVGKGGMGVVFEATHSWTGRKVAIKLLNPVHTEDPDTVQRFLREAQTIASLRHPHIVDVLDMGRDDDGSLFIALELLRGTPLSDLLADRGALPPGEALDLLLPVMDALTYAHEKGFIHRDLKPENIILTHGKSGDVVPKLLDFGIAKIVGDTGGTRTRTGVVVGTPQYMAPEQARGRQDLTQAADIWSMGVVLFEALSATRPFEGESAPEVLAKLLTDRAPSLRARVQNLGDGLVGAVDLALRREPRERYPDMRSFAATLVEAARLHGVPLSRTTVESLNLRDARPMTTSIAPTLVTGEHASEPPAPSTRPPSRAPAPTSRIFVPPMSPDRRAWLLVGASIVLAASVVAAVWVATEPAAAPPTAAPREPASVETGAGRPPTTPAGPPVAADPTDAGGPTQAVAAEDGVPAAEDAATPTGTRREPTPPHGASRGADATTRTGPGGGRGSPASGPRRSDAATGGTPEREATPASTTGGAPTIRSEW